MYSCAHFIIWKFDVKNSIFDENCRCVRILTRVCFSNMQQHDVQWFHWMKSSIKHYWEKLFEIENWLFNKNANVIFTLFDFLTKYEVKKFWIELFRNTMNCRYFIWYVANWNVYYTCFQSTYLTISKKHETMTRLLLERKANVKTKIDNLSKFDNKFITSSIRRKNWPWSWTCSNMHSIVQISKTRKK